MRFALSISWWPGFQSSHQVRDASDRVLVGRSAAAGSGAGLNDRELLERFARRGDQAAFATLFRRHSSMVLGVCRRVLGHPQDAEDVLQNLCVRLLRRQLPTDFSKNPKAYLYRAAVNLSLNVIRSRLRTVAADPAIETEDPASRSRSRGEEEIFETLRRTLAQLHEKRN